MEARRCGYKLPAKTQIQVQGTYNFPMVTEEERNNSNGEGALRFAMAIKAAEKNPVDDEAGPSDPNAIGDAQSDQWAHCRMGNQNDYNFHKNFLLLRNECIHVSTTSYYSTVIFKYYCIL